MLKFLCLLSIVLAPGGPFLNNWQFSSPFASFPKASAQLMVVAASNRGIWEAGKPGATERIVLDKNWRCKGYPDLPGISRKQWSSSENVKTIIQQAISDKSEQSWLPAVEIYAGDFWIWADGLDEENELPAANVICMKDLNFK